MKGIMFLLVVLVVLVAFKGLAFCTSSECELIKDSDQRHYCRALTQHKKTWCEFIKDSDLKHRCRAIVDVK